MTLFVILFVLYGLSSLFEGLETLFDATNAVMSSYSGMIIAAVVTAFLTYRWYRARHQETGE